MIANDRWSIVEIEMEELSHQITDSQFGRVVLDFDPDKWLLEVLVRARRRGSRFQPDLPKTTNLKTWPTESKRIPDSDDLYRLRKRQGYQETAPRVVKRQDLTSLSVNRLMSSSGGKASQYPETGNVMVEIFCDGTITEATFVIKLVPNIVVDLP